MAMKDQMASIWKFVAGSQKDLEVVAPYEVALADDRFRICDPADRTKCVRLDAGAVTTATERVFSFPDLDVNAGSSTGQRKTVVDTAGVYATPIVLTAADSGKVYLLDDAAGLDFTLPAIAAADVGIYYSFRVLVSNTSNSYRLTAQTGDIINGHVLMPDFDAAYTAPQILAAEGGGTTLVMTMAAIAKGGGIGGWFEIEALTATSWFVSGSLISDGTIVTPFS